LARVEKERTEKKKRNNLYGGARGKRLIELARERCGVLRSGSGEKKKKRAVHHFYLAVVLHYPIRERSEMERKESRGS